MRALRRAHGGADGDGPTALLAFAVAGLPADRQVWGRAMRAELDQVVGAVKRWQFSVGCTWAAAVIRARTTLGSRERGGEVLRLVVFAGITSSLGLVAYGLVQYPGLRTGVAVWASMTAFLAVLFIYGTVTISLSRGNSPEISLPRRYGLAGGLTIGGAWLAALSPPHDLKTWVAAPLVVALFGPACVAALAGRQHRDVRIGTRAALWAGIVAGLGVFVVWVATTYASARGPYDAGTMRDFHSSHATDLTTYAISDNLGSALVLLLLIPTFALAVGSLTAQIASRTSRLS